MNPFAKIASATLMSAIAFGSYSYASDASKMVKTPQQIDAIVKNDKAPRFNVVALDSLDRSDPVFARYHERNPAKSKESLELQASIKANKVLSNDLKTQKVELSNIIAAEQAADGGLTIYVR
ncbi:hypothetical protein HFC70_17130 [Agrobacterium sp. a22-2]|uniref:hypothetical protein n=1 Tax=Agrobacterium sp. a22-2 TaxID=2283840 RepID=UPI0014457C18|nr:hypothetical protein [Agrobacterium sp. a22-2]NKN38079.1 hypothetical protein [Agrobacterium sp. a22-2]